VTEGDLDSTVLESPIQIRVHASVWSRAGFHQTDLGNAECLVARFGHDIRYTDEAGWHTWDSRRWAPDPGLSRVMRYAALTVRAMYEEASRMTDDAARLALVKHARLSEARPRLEAMVALAKHQVNARLSDFDRDPHLLNVKNGTIDLKTGILRAHCK